MGISKKKNGVIHSTKPPRLFVISLPVLIACACLGTFIGSNLAIFYSVRENKASDIRLVLLGFVLGCLIGLAVSKSNNIQGGLSLFIAHRFVFRMLYAVGWFIVAPFVKTKFRHV